MCVFVGAGLAAYADPSAQGEGRGRCPSRGHGCRAGPSAGREGPAQGVAASAAGSEQELQQPSWLATGHGENVGWGMGCGVGMGLGVGMGAWF